MLIYQYKPEFTGKHASGKGEEVDFEQTYVFSGEPWLLVVCAWVVVVVVVEVVVVMMWVVVVVVVCACVILW